MADIESGLNDAESVYADAIRAHTAAVIERIRLSVSQGLDTENLFATIGAVVAPNRAAKEKCLRILKGVRDFGRSQVKEELSRQ